MDRKGLDAAQFALDRAHQAVDELTSTKDFDEIERHWSTFLENFSRAFNKLEKTIGKGNARWAPIAIERKADPLLQYLEQARNAEAHGLEPITIKEPGMIREAGVRLVDEADARKGVEGTLEIRDPHVRLVQVINFGVAYAVPTCFQGSQISAAHPANLALLGLSYLQAKITSFLE